MKQIKIITDTASDITLETAKEYGIHLIPINLSIDGIQYKDKYDIDCKQFINLLKNSKEFPKTSQITVGEHYDEFKKFSDDYSIIYCCISKNASGTYQSANMAKQMIEEENPEADINIVNCDTFSYCYGLWVIEAAKMAKLGTSTDEIVNMIENNSQKSAAILMVDDISYLEKGGRIKSAEKILGTLLDIKPILTIQDGLISPIDKVRGAKKVNKKLIEILLRDALPDYEQTIIIYHVDCEQKAEEIKNAIIENTQFKNFIVVEIGPTISAHIGPGAYAIGFLKK